MKHQMKIGTMGNHEAAACLGYAPGARKKPEAL
jgi:hypothetical protein